MSAVCGLCGAPLRPPMRHVCTAPSDKTEGVWSSPIPAYVKRAEARARNAGLEEAAEVAEGYGSEDAALIARDIRSRKVVEG